MGWGQHVGSAPSPSHNVVFDRERTGWLQPPRLRVGERPATVTSYSLLGALAHDRFLHPSQARRTMPKTMRNVYQ